MTRGKVRAPNTEWTQVGKPLRGGSYAINRLWNKTQQQQPWEVFQELLPTEPLVPLTLLLEDGNRTRPMQSKDDFDYRVFLRDHFAVAHPSHYLMETETPFIMLAYHKSTQLLCLLCSLHRRDIHLPHLLIESIRTFLEVNGAQVSSW